MASRDAQQALLDAREEIAEDPEALPKWLKVLAGFVIAEEVTQSDIMGALAGVLIANGLDESEVAREVNNGLRDAGAPTEPPKKEIAQADLQDAAREVASASQGTRHKTLYERAALMGKHVRAGTLTSAEVRAALMSAWETATSGRSKEGSRTISDGLGDARGAFQYARRPEQGTAWVDIFKVGTEVHKDGHVVNLDRPTIVTMMQNFGRMKRDGHEVVVLREHEREGHVFGFVHGLRLFEGYLQAELEFLRPEDRIAYNNGQLRRFSPGFTLNFQHPHTGEEWGPTLFEVSFVAMPFQTNLRPPQEASPETRLAFNYSGEIITQMETDMAIEAKTEAPVEEPVEASDVKLAADEEGEEGEKTDIMGEMYALMKEMYALMKPEEEEEEEMGADEALSDQERQIRELSAKVDRLHDEKTRVELKAAGVPDEHHDRLVKLSRTDRELFEFTADKLGGTPETVQRPIGRMGDADVGRVTSPAAILAQAEKQGVSYSSGLTPWLKEHYPEEAPKVATLARQKFNKA